MQLSISETGRPWPDDKALRVDPLPRGDEQTSLTIAAMSAVVDESAAHESIRQAAAGLLRTVQRRDRASLDGTMVCARRLYDLGREQVRFRRDPAGVEFLRLPAAMVAEIMHQGHAEGDCDEASMLACALAKAGGLRPAFVTIARTGGGPFVHVLPALIAGDAVIPFDAQEGYPPGVWPEAGRRVVWPVGRPGSPETTPRAL